MFDRNYDIKFELKNFQPNDFSKFSKLRKFHKSQKNKTSFSLTELLASTVSIGKTSVSFFGIRFINFKKARKYWIIYKMGLVHPNIRHYFINKINSQMNIVLCSLDFKSPANELTHSPVFHDMSQTEKSNASYFLGMAFAKLFAKIFLDVPWLIDFERVEGEKIIKRYSNTRSKPDLVGLMHKNTRIVNDYIVLEAKGRDRKSNFNKARKTALKQAGVPCSIGNVPPIISVASILYPAPNNLKLHWELPNGSNNLGASYSLDKNKLLELESFWQLDDHKGIDSLQKYNLLRSSLLNFIYTNKILHHPELYDMPLLKKLRVGHNASIKKKAKFRYWLAHYFNAYNLFNLQEEYIPKYSMVFNIELNEKAVSVYEYSMLCLLRETFIEYFLNKTSSKLFVKFTYEFLNQLLKTEIGDALHKIPKSEVDKILHEMLHTLTIPKMEFEILKKFKTSRELDDKYIKTKLEIEICGIFNKISEDEINDILHEISEVEIGVAFYKLSEVEIDDILDKIPEANEILREISKNTKGDVFESVLKREPLRNLLRFGGEKLYKEFRKSVEGIHEHAMEFGNDGIIIKILDDSWFSPRSLDGQE